ncbi:CAP domain-containing protein [Lactobacillus sp. Sy-1]|uniref:CAP domain-containing protein n=1 Tax=Lactobacillus sp. Sy-1 TaxID=2109645 RepID=UPI001C5AAF73|nr:CAP domain-containing protein [Lactobacillus sp. Sy-1]MBW1606344.1 hypothetical protein [Lactobacillus sp. Sy-1]
MKKFMITFTLALSIACFSKGYHTVHADTSDSTTSSQTTTSDDNNQSDQSSDSSDDSDSGSDSSDSDQSSNVQPTKTITFHYQTTSGKQISPDVTETTNGNSFYSYAFNYDGTEIKPYVKAIKGYVTYYQAPDQLTYDNLPSSITVKYVKASDAAKQMSKYYMQYLNRYRNKLKLKSLKTSSDLNKKANVRAKELEKYFSHVRPNGTSYNTKNSGYGEVMLGVDLIYSGPNKTLNYQKTAENCAKTLLTEDALHRDTLLNTWSSYGAAGFNLSDNGSTLCGLFKL